MWGQRWKKKPREGKRKTERKKKETERKVVSVALNTLTVDSMQLGRK